jgi:hypothetical protein
LALGRTLKHQLDAPCERPFMPGLGSGHSSRELGWIG